MNIEKIISGGQSGSDRGGLDAAIYLGIPHGGWCPKYRLAEDGRIPDIYKLRETQASGYRSRTYKNIEDSDGTIIFNGLSQLNGGSLLTYSYCKQLNKPYLIIHGGDGDIGAQLFNFLQTIKIVNIAGNRESKCPGIQEFTKKMLIDVLS